MLFFFQLESITSADFSKLMPKQVTKKKLSGTCTFSYKTNKQTNKKSPKSVVTVVGGAVPARQTWRESPVMLTVGVLSGCVHPLCLATVNGSGRLATLQALTTRQESDRGASRVLWRKTGVRTPRTPARTALFSADSSLPSTAPNFCLSRSSILLLLLCRCV